MTDARYTSCGPRPAEPMVCRLTAGGNEIRTPGPFFPVKGLFGAFERHFSVESGRGVLFRSRRVRGVELPITLLDPASPFVPGNGDADMVRANPRACGGDFLLRLTRCQGKDLIAEAWRAAISASWFRRCGAPAPARLCGSRRFHSCGGGLP